MSPSNELFRPNAAAIYMRPNGTILICERVKPRDSWQFPQGGVTKNEDPLEAAKREGMEETGLRPNEYEVKGSFGPYRYKYNEKDRARVLKKRGIPYAGQEQNYYLFVMHNDHAEPWLDNKEFCEYRWIKPEDMNMKQVPKFKRNVYYQVFEDVFGLDLRPCK